MVGKCACKIVGSLKLERYFKSEVEKKFFKKNPCKNFTLLFYNLKVH